MGRRRMQAPSGSRFRQKIDLRVIRKPEDLIPVSGGLAPGHGKAGGHDPPENLDAPGNPQGVGHIRHGKRQMPGIACHKGADLFHIQNAGHTLRGILQGKG